MSLRAHPVLSKYVLDRTRDALCAQTMLRKHVLLCSGAERRWTAGQPLERDARQVGFGDHLGNRTAEPAQVLCSCGVKRAPVSCDAARVNYDEEAIGYQRQMGSGFSGAERTAIWSGESESLCQAQLAELCS